MSPITQYGEVAFSNGEAVGWHAFRAVPEGTYVARTYSNNSYNLIAESAPFTVSATSPQGAPESYERGRFTEVPHLFAHGERVGRVVYAADDLPTQTSGRQHVFLELPDHLGSTSTVIDRETGELVEQSRYQAYGEGTAENRSQVAPSSTTQTNQAIFNNGVQPFKAFRHSAGERHEGSMRSASRFQESTTRACARSAP